MAHSKVSTDTQGSLHSAALKAGGLTLVVEDNNGNPLTAIPAGQAFVIAGYFSENVTDPEAEFYLSYGRSDATIKKFAAYTPTGGSYFRVTIAEAVRSYATGDCFISLTVRGVGSADITLPIV